MLLSASGLEVLATKADNVRNIKEAQHRDRIRNLSEEDLVYERLAVQWEFVCAMRFLEGVGLVIFSTGC